MRGDLHRIIGAPGALIPGWFPLVADPLSRLVGPHDLVRETVHGSEMLLDPTDYTQRKILFRSFEPREVRVVRRLLRPGDTAVDIGANVGFFTLLMARAVGPAGRVVAYEPIGPNRDALERNLGLNRYENVEIRVAAVGAERGEVALTLPELTPDSPGFTSGRWRRVEGSDAGQGLIRVPQVRLDEELADARVRLVKIDVEGMEPSVLAGMSRMLEEHRVDALLAEVAHAPRAEVVEPLRRRGYSVRTVDIFARAAGVYNVIARVDTRGRRPALTRKAKGS